MEIRNTARPRALRACQGELIPQSYKDVAYRGDLDGGSNLVYIGYARPGSPSTAAVWQIKKITYTGTTPVQIQWPIGSDGTASNDYDQIWDNRASLVWV